jgi:hypothetical protein
MCKDFISDPYPLSGGRIARIRLGLQPPGEGDCVVAEGYVLLPAKGMEILPEIQFQERLSIMRHDLYSWWGIDQSLLPPKLRHLEGEWKFNVAKFHAPTWREAMTAAWEYAHAEIMKLEEALARRLKALEEAECSENMGVQTIKRKIQVKGGQE